MKCITQVLLLCTVLPSISHSQEHSHGHGSIFLVQEDKRWQVVYVLPASDALGFEHKPQNQQQKARFSQLKETLSHFGNLAYFDTKCEQNTYSHNLLKLGHDEQHHNHSDIEVTYSITCMNDVNLILFPIFNQMPSLKKLDAQWSTTHGQGSVTITNSSPQLEFR